MAFRVDVTITNPDGQKATISGAFEFNPPAPVIHSISPASGSAAGGDAVTIAADFVQPGAVVLFGEKQANDVQVSEDGKTVTVVTPAML